MASQQDNGVREEWRKNWPLVLCSLLGIPVPIFAIYVLGQFMPSLEHDLGWSRTQASAGMSLSLALTFLLTPVAGRVVDVFNARWLVLAGITLSSLALAGFSLATRSPALWFAIWTCHALAAVFAGQAVWLAVISQAFDKGRSLAMAISLCGVSLPAAIAPPLARFLIDDLGWRSAYQVLGMIVGVPSLLACMFLFFDRRHLGAAARSAQASEKATRPPLRGIFLSPTFFKLALAVLMSFTASAGFMIHLAPALHDKGLSPVMAAAIAGGTALFAVPGKITLGGIFDRASTSVVAIGLMMIFALACVLMAMPVSNSAVVIVASVALGICSGGLVALLACVTPRLFAPSVFGSVYAVLLSLTALGGALGPLFASLVHDATGSYSAAFWAGSAGALISAILYASSKPVLALQASPD